MKFVKRGITRKCESKEIQENKKSSEDKHSAPTVNSSPPPTHHGIEKKRRKISSISTSSSSPCLPQAEETSIQEDASHAEQKDRATRAKEEVLPNQSTRSIKPEDEHSAATANSFPPPSLQGRKKKKVRVFRTATFYTTPFLCVPQHHTLTRVRRSDSQGPVTNAQVRRQGPRTRMSFQAEETSVQEDASHAEQKDRATRAKEEVLPNQSTRSIKPEDEAEETSVQEDALSAEQKERSPRAENKVGRNQFTRSRKPKNEYSASSPPPPSLQAEEPFVQEDVQAYAVQTTTRTTRSSRSPDYEHSTSSPPPPFLQAEEPFVQEDAPNAQQKDRATRAKEEVLPNQSTRSIKPEDEHSAPPTSTSPPPSLQGRKKKMVRVFRIATFYTTPSLCIPQHRPLNRAMTMSRGLVTNARVRRQGPRTRMSFQAEETSVQEDASYAEQKARSPRAEKKVSRNQSTRSRNPKNEHSAPTTSSPPPPSLQAEEPFVQEDARAYAVQKKRTTRSRPPEYEHSASSPPPPSLQAEEPFVQEDAQAYAVQTKRTTRSSRSPDYEDSSSTMRASRRQRCRLPPRRPPPHRPLTRELTKPRRAVTRGLVCNVRARDPGCCFRTNYTQFFV